MADKDPQVQIEQVNIVPSTPEPIQRQAIEVEAESSKRGQTIGLVVIVLGALLSVLGVAGVVDLKIDIPGFSTQAQQAAPGVVLMLIGFAIVILSRPSITTGKKP